MTFEFSPESGDIEYNKNLKQSSTKRVLVAQADKPHHVMSAGQAMIFVFLTIMVGTVLNSSALYTKATAMKPSLARTLATNTLEPFDSLSRAIGLTSLRRGTRSAMDLPRDDKIDTFSFSGNSPKKPATSTTLPMLGPNNKLTMWVIGDSLSITPGESILSTFSTNAFDIKGMEGKVSTGLSRPDVFNWFSHIRDYVAINKPQVIVATFGANDDQYLFADTGSVGPFGSERWKQEYLNRVSSTLDYLASQGTHTLWVEIPPVRDPVRNDRYKIINEITKKAVLAHPTTASYVETKQAFTNPDGSYSDSVVINGTPTLLRAPDGIHFTRAGGNLIAELVLKKLGALYSF